MTELVCFAEDEMLGGCRVGDTRAWRMLHRRYYPVAGAFLRKLGVSERDVDDCAQDVFLELFRYLHGFRGDAQFKTWLYRLCVTQARRARRRERLTRTLLSALALVAPERLVSAPGFSESEALRRVHLALQRLPPTLRETFVLFEMEGLPGKLVAEVLRCPEPTVWRRLHEARKAFTHAVNSTAA
jgi:RNA polymerase sigma-70 factor (ECF subfamily)